MMWCNMCTMYNRCFVVWFDCVNYSLQRIERIIKVQRNKADTNGQWTQFFSLWTISSRWFKTAHHSNYYLITECGQWLLFRSLAWGTQAKARRSNCCWSHDHHSVRRFSLRQITIFSSLFLFFFVSVVFIVFRVLMSEVTISINFTQFRIWLAACFSNEHLSNLLSSTHAKTTGKNVPFIHSIFSHKTEKCFCSSTASNLVIATIFFFLVWWVCSPSKCLNQSEIFFSIFFF